MNKLRHHGWRIVCLLSVSLLLSGCLSNTSYAPVVNAWQQPEAQSGTYFVRKGDTLHPGQRLRMTAPPRLRTYVATKSRPKTTVPVPERHGQVVKVYSGSKKWQAQTVWRNKPAPRWGWPARGRVIQGFSANLAGNRGINISGRLGEPVHSAASGVVVYSGDGVRGYGNLLIIKHNDSYLSAYAYNRKLLVRLGQRVRAGQTIAEMGRNNAGRVMLHFEIRRNGRPVNPKRYLRS